MLSLAQLVAKFFDNIPVVRRPVVPPYEPKGFDPQYGERHSTQPLLAGRHVGRKSKAQRLRIAQRRENWLENRRMIARRVHGQ